MTSEPDFDRVARSYRWLEYLTFGSILHRTRLHHLLALEGRKQALVLGDGDGRFTAALLARNSVVRITAVDLSQEMLALLCIRAQPFSDRVTTHRQNVLTFTPAVSPDLIVTHFLLDCLTQEELNLLLSRLVPRLQPAALWLVSDFRIPGGLIRWPARLFIRLLYLAFRLITGLRITQLPNHSVAFETAGLTCLSAKDFLFGLLTTELWTLNPVRNDNQGQRNPSHLRRSR